MRLSLNRPPISPSLARPKLGEEEDAELNKFCSTHHWGKIRTGAEVAEISPTPTQLAWPNRPQPDPRRAGSAASAARRGGTSCGRPAPPSPMEQESSGA